jgi:CBS domain-containing protein
VPDIAPLLDAEAAWRLVSFRSAIPAGSTGRSRPHRRRTAYINFTNRKGSNVVSIAPDRTIAEVVNVLNECRISALVVIDGKDAFSGIISERDIVGALSRNGADILTQKVADLMTRNVRSCSCHDTIAEVMNIMTQGRFRHLPVVEDGKLVGLISIGDVVKQRLDDAELEVETLRGYVTM